MLVAIDAFDRRVEREWFIDTLAVVLDTAFRIGCNAVTGGIRADFAAGRASDEGFAQLQANLQQQLENNRTSLIRRMGALAEMPWSVDTIH